MSSGAMLKVPVTKGTARHRGRDADETFPLPFPLRKLSFDGKVLQSKGKTANIFWVRLTSLSLSIWRAPYETYHQI